jgi:O-antigen ligase
MIVTSVICSSDACLVAVAAGGVVWLLVYAFGRTAAKVLVGLVAAPFVLAPLAVLVGVETGSIAWLHKLVPASWDSRLNIWTFAADHVQNHPVPGLGAGRQPHLRSGDSAAHPQRPASAVAGAGGDRRGPGGGVLLLAGLRRRAAQ